MIALLVQTKIVLFSGTCLNLVLAQTINEFGQPSLVHFLCPIIVCVTDGSKKSCQKSGQGICRVR